MVAGEGLLDALRLALRVVACGNAFSLTLESNLSRSFSSFPNGSMKVCAIWIIWEGTKEMVAGEGLLDALRLALRVVACGNAFSLRSNRTLVEASHPSPTGI